MATRPVYAEYVTNPYLKVGPCNGTTANDRCTILGLTSVIPYRAAFTENPNTSVRTTSKMYIQKMYGKFGFTLSSVTIPPLWDFGVRIMLVRDNGANFSYTGSPFFPTYEDVYAISGAGGTVSQLLWLSAYLRRDRGGRYTVLYDKTYYFNSIMRKDNTGTTYVGGSKGLQHFSFSLPHLKRARGYVNNSNMSMSTNDQNRGHLYLILTTNMPDTLCDVRFTLRHRIKYFNL